MRSSPPVRTMVAVALLFAWGAETALPLAAMGKPHAGHPRPASRQAEKPASSGRHEHHHPGCPWQGKGPCPHQRADDTETGRPFLTECAQSPMSASYDAAARLAPIVPEGFDWSPRLASAALAPEAPGAGPPLGASAPDPPPPRSLPTP